MSATISTNEDSNKIDLGFAEFFEQPWLNKCKYFPSKIGGKVAFLVLDTILGPDELTCSKCHRVMRFVLQIYAPIDTINSAFHRTIYIFACGASSECLNEFKVFRSQLPKVNRFYSENAPDYENDSSEYDPNPQNFDNKLCPVCGLLAPNHCAQCLKVNYCSREHQVFDWRNGGHKLICKSLADGVNIEQVVTNSETTKSKKNFCFPEYDLTIDDSESEDDEETNEEEEPMVNVVGKLKPCETDELKIRDDDNPEEEEEDLSTDQLPENNLEMKKYLDYVETNKPVFQDEDLNQYVQANDTPNEEEEVDEEQKIFNKFKAASAADEVIRYRRMWFESDSNSASDDILWISSKNRIDPSKDVPNCKGCGAKRIFEFQVMPQLLNKLLLSDRSSDDHLDWGTLLVFSCPKSCIPKYKNQIYRAYIPEFIYNQTIVS